MLICKRLEKEAEMGKIRVWCKKNIFLVIIALMLIYWIVGAMLVHYYMRVNYFFAVIGVFAGTIALFIWIAIFVEWLMDFVWKERDGRVLRLAICLLIWVMASSLLTLCTEYIWVAVLAPVALVVLFAPAMAACKDNSSSGNDNYDPMIGSF